MGKFGADGKLEVGDKCPVCKKGKVKESPKDGTGGRRLGGEGGGDDAEEGRDFLECAKCGTAFPELIGDGRADG